MGNIEAAAKTQYEKEILQCMIMAKEKVKKLAAKLHTAKEHISKLSKENFDEPIESSLENANQIISEYADANTSLVLLELTF